MSGEKGIVERGVERVLVLLYAKEKRVARIVLLLTCVGFVLRLIAALHLGVLADDMLYASQSAGIVSAKILSTHSNPPLFFYLTGLAYKLFGYTTFASRFWPLIFGTLLIPLSFLLTRKLLNERIALFAAFFVTFSTFLIRMTFAEQTLVVLFFAFFGTFLGLCYLESRSLKHLTASAALFGLAFLTKYSAPFFILAFLAFGVYALKKNSERVFTKKNVQRLAIFAAIIILFALPFLAFNYFIYQEKGIVDVYFSRVIHVEKAQQLYQGLAGQEQGFFKALTTPASYANVLLVFQTDLVLALFALVGFVLMLRRKEQKAIAFFVAFLVIPFVLQSAGSVLYKHFAFMHFLFAMPAGAALAALSEKMPGRAARKGMIVVLALILVASLGNSSGTPQHYLSASDTSQLKSFLADSVQPDELILFDSRIYTAQVFWLATPHHFMTFEQFAQIYASQQNASGKRPTNVYVVECVIEDCGWGWIAKPQGAGINASSEAMLDNFRAAGKAAAMISAPTYAGNEFFKKTGREERYRVYRLTLDLHPGVLAQIDELQSFYFTPYLYKNMREYAYAYRVEGMDALLEKLSRFILLLSILLSILSVLAVLVYL